MTAVWEDPRVARGMEAQLAARRARIAAGDKPLGWKVGFGAPAAMEKLKITAPLVGFMTDRSLVPSGSSLSFARWTKPIAEPEIAVYMGKELAAGADRATAATAIAALGPAIELVDLHRPPDDPEDILSGNIYHRHVVLAARDPARAGARLDGLSGRVSRNGSEIASVTDFQANTGEVLLIVAHVASMLAAFGERLSADDVIICGSVVPPIALEPHDRAIGFGFNTASDAMVAIVP